MSFPIRWNPVDVVFEAQDDGTTVVDDDYRVPLGERERGAQFTLDGQPALKRRSLEQVLRTRAGDDESSRLKIVIPTKVFKAAVPTRWDATNKEPTIVKGYKVVSIAGRPCDLVVVEVRPQSPLRGGVLLWYVELEQAEEA
jgi:hypothetical protein